MTTIEAKELYKKVLEDILNEMPEAKSHQDWELALENVNRHGEIFWEDIRDDLQKVITAKSDRAAGRIIQYWKAWDKEITATCFARFIRRL
jgi:hypothetical protein